MILTGAGLYMLIMLGVGFYASRGKHSVAEFIVAGRSLPLWICSVSIFATWFGSGIMMGAATSGYDHDVLLMIGEPFGSGLALLLSGLFFARIMRRAPIIRATSPSTKMLRAEGPRNGLACT